MLPRLNKNSSHSVFIVLQLRKILPEHNCDRIAAFIARLSVSDSLERVELCGEKKFPIPISVNIVLGSGGVPCRSTIPSFPFSSRVPGSLLVLLPFPVFPFHPPLANSLLAPCIRLEVRESHTVAKLRKLRWRITSYSSSVP